MPLQEDYQVTLDAFQGPLDLLLFLIRRAEVDVHDIPIAAVTDQYLAFLRGIDDVDVDQAGEFLVMAATLVEIKSRTLMPPETRPARDGEERGAAVDPREELVQQLLAYQRYRIAVEALEAHRAEFDRRFPGRPARAPLADDEQREPPALELEDAHVYDLYEAYERLMSSIDLARLGDHLVEIDDTPIALHQEDLLDRLARADDRRIALQDAFEGKGTGQRVGLFLATLELARLRRVLVRQDDVDDAIVLELNAEADEPPATAPEA